VTGVLSLQAVATQLGKTPEQISDAYTAEAADQARRCRSVVGDSVGVEALGGALVRRVQRALEMRNVPLGVVMDETGGTRVGTTDPEVRRLEGPLPQGGARVSTRTEIVAALQGLDGITAHEHVVATLEPGTAYARLDRIEYPNRFGGVAFWNVVLVLPQALPDAERFLEQHLHPVKDALSPVLPITSVVPQRLEIPGTATVTVAFFNGHREAD
jgi:hypothetical protein